MRGQRVFFRNPVPPSPAAEFLVPALLVCSLSEPKRRNVGVAYGARSTPVFGVRGCCWTASIVFITLHGVSVLTAERYTRKASAGRSYRVFRMLPVPPSATVLVLATAPVR